GPPLPSVCGLGPFTAALVRFLVWPQTLETRLAQQAVLGPFSIGNLGDQLRLDPMHVAAPWRLALVKGYVLLGQFVEALAQVEQSFARVAGADLAGVNEAFAVVTVIANEQSPQADARALRIRKARPY